MNNLVITDDVKYSDIGEVVRPEEIIRTIGDMKSDHLTYVVISDHPEMYSKHIPTNNLVNATGKTEEAIRKEICWISSDFGNDKTCEDVFVISDTHFFHKNIIEYCNRPFNSVEEMNETMIKRWNSVVGKNDIVYHLGDFALGNKNNVCGLVERLNGKIMLIMGNHDRHNIEFYYDAGFYRVYDKPIVFHKTFILSHVPMEFVKTPFVNLFGHVHSSDMYKTWSKNGVCLCVERHDYTPVRFSRIVEGLDTITTSKGSI